MARIVGVVLLLAGLSGFALARICVAGTCPAPEIDPGMGGSALALLAGGLMMIWSRRKK
jgi:hypothetical protein